MNDLEILILLTVLVFANGAICGFERLGLPVLSSVFTVAGLVYIAVKYKDVLGAV